MSHDNQKRAKEKAVEIKFPNYPTIAQARKEQAEKIMREPIKDKRDDLWETPQPWYDH